MNAPGLGSTPQFCAETAMSGRRFAVTYPMWHAAGAAKTSVEIGIGPPSLNILHHLATSSSVPLHFQLPPTSICFCGGDPLARYLSARANARKGRRERRAAAPRQNALRAARTPTTRGW